MNGDLDTYEIGLTNGKCFLISVIINKQQTTTNNFFFWKGYLPLDKPLMSSSY